MATDTDTSINCATAEQVVHHWLAGKAAHTKKDSIQAGGVGNGLLMRQYATYYNGSRFWTDGATIYSYTTPLAKLGLRESDGAFGVVWQPYYYGKQSATSKRHIRAIESVISTL